MGVTSETTDGSRSVPKGRGDGPIGDESDVRESSEVPRLEDLHHRVD